VTGPGSVERGLNSAQREAVLTTEGPLLVLAGAGTGKTRVITHRIAHLLGKGVSPERVLAVTFTNKAAREMRERVSGLLGRAPKGLTISTFHSLGARMLRDRAAILGYRRDFNIYDTSDQIAVMRTVLRELAAHGAPGTRTVLGEISLAKNALLSPADLEAAASDDRELYTARAYERYQEALRSMSCVDFDDLIYVPVELLRKEPDVRQEYRARFRYILVDEYQDTNGAQYELLRLLVGPDRNVCVVGDDDQSIYAFRGADREKILGFERDFPGARVVKLEENYRSTGAILDLANAVISQSAGRHAKSLQSRLGPGSPVRWIAVPDETREVELVIREIRRLIGEGVPPPSIAILVRSVILARGFEEKLRLRKVPYTVVGGQSWFDRKEVRDLVAYWMVAANPRDDMSLLRIVNVPRRGIGGATLRKMDELARSRGGSLLDALGLAARGEGGFPQAVRESAASITDIFRQARERLEARRYPEMTRGIVEESSYRDAVAELYPDAAAQKDRWQEVEDLLSWVERWHAETPAADFGDFLEAAALDRDVRPDEKKRRGITLMTLHAAKGLEFTHVFLAGVEEGILPHRRSLDEEGGVEEERRLLYVGVTRARKELMITHARARAVHGPVKPRTPSRFLLEAAALGKLEAEPYDGDEAPSEDEVAGFLEEWKSRRGKVTDS
jgi:DNA helicase-2/ATP-dependent DNA helicase PcrA